MRCGTRALCSHTTLPGRVWWWWRLWIRVRFTFWNIPVGGGWWHCPAASSTPVGAPDLCTTLLNATISLLYNATIFHVLSALVLFRLWIVLLVALCHIPALMMLELLALCYLCMAPGYSQSVSGSVTSTPPAQHRADCASACGGNAVPLPAGLLQPCANVYGTLSAAAGECVMVAERLLGDGLLGGWWGCVVRA